jgi:hypothetical protein
MLAEIASGLGSLKAAKDIVQGLNAAKTEAAINGVKIELQGLILDAQQGLFAAQEAQSADTRRIADLEQEIVRLKDWTTEKESYQLVAVDRGAFAYMPKPGMEKGEPAHWLCTNCFNHGHKSFMQHKGHGTSVGGRSDEALFGCDSCKASMRVHWSNKPSYSVRDQPLQD